MLKKNLKNVINKIGYKFLKIDKEEAKFLENTYRLYEKYSSYTMIPKNTFIENLKLCRNLSTIHGCVVECGVWRGGMIAAIIVDDYYVWDGCSRAIHDYLSIHKIPCRIRQIQSNCYIIKE